MKLIVKYKKPLLLASLLSFLLTLPNCAGDQQAAVNVTLSSDSYCEVNKKQSWSVNDTPETIEQINKENMVWDKLCGPGAKKK